MADVQIQSRPSGKQTPGSQNCKDDDYIERFRKFKEAKQTDILQERGNSQKNSGQKRKSCSATTPKVPFKKTKENTMPNTIRSKSHLNPTKKMKKPMVNQCQTTTPKSTPAMDKESAGTTGKEPTPMLERLKRWKEEKQKRVSEKSKDNRRSCQGLSSSSKKYVKPGGQPKTCDTLLQSRTQTKVSLTSHRTVGNERSSNKWERLYQGSATKPRNAGTSKTSVSSRGLTTEQTVIRSKSQGTVNKYQPNSRGVTSQRVEVKRRHSEVQARGSPLRRRGILKRKSCIASFGDNEETEANNKSEDGPTTQSPRDQTDETAGRVLPCRTPDTTRTVRFCSPGAQTGNTTFRKTPSKQSREESMRNKLNDWLAAKGKTPSKFRHLMCFDAKMSARKRNDPKAKRSITVEELTQQQQTIEHESTVAVSLTGMFDKVADEEEEDEDEDAGKGRNQEDPGLSQLRTILDECTILFEAGCPYTDILKWLDSIEQNLPLARKSAIFYICKAKVLQSTADLDRVLKVFEEAVVNSAQPAQELATALTTIVKEVSEERERKAQQKAIKKRVQEENIFESTSIKYCVRQVTPFTKRSRRSTGDSSVGSQCKVLTPVRRSTRRSLVNLPDSLQEKTPVFNTLEEISNNDKKKTLYKENEALEPILLDFNDSDNDM